MEPGRTIIGAGDTCMNERTRHQFLSNCHGGSKIDAGSKIAMTADPPNKVIVASNAVPTEATPGKATAARLGQPAGCSVVGKQRH